MQNNPILMVDFYKLCHKKLYPKNMTKSYALWIPRSNQYLPKSDCVIWFGIQGFIKKYLIDEFNKNFFERPLEEIIDEYVLYVYHTFDQDPDVSHIEALHKLGYLPIEIKALNEGTKVPYRVPCMAVTNTHPDFAWLVNYLETLISCNLWQPTTAASISYIFRSIMDKYVNLTSDNKAWKSIGCGDFSFRGMSSFETSLNSGAAFMTSFTKTSSIPAIKYLCDYYGADIKKELIGNWSASVEHSCTTSNFTIDGDEETFFVRMATELYPEGNFSFVADSYDYWSFFNIIKKHKEMIMARNGCIRIRPDSGDPLKIICGNAKIKDFNKEIYVKSLNDAKRWMSSLLENDVRYTTPHGERGESESEGIFKYKDTYYKLVIDVEWNRYDKQFYFIEDTSIISCEEIEPSYEQIGSLEVLWNIIGGTINSKGYRVLDKSIGLVYGDAMTLDRVEAICKRMMEMGFAIENVVFGVGSYSLNMISRDSQGFAYKMTYAEIDSKDIMIYKDPMTDSGTKRSPRGMCHVHWTDNGKIDFQDGLTLAEINDHQSSNLLQPIFRNGQLLKETTLKEIRSNIYGGNF